MHRDFLKLVSESYLVDNPYARDSLTSDKIYSYLVSLVENIKYNDPCFYEFLFKIPKTEQLDILYSIITEDLLNKDVHIEEAVSPSGIGAVIAKVFGGTMKAVTTALTALANFGDSIRNFFAYTLRGEQGRVYNEILYKRLQKCSKLCGVESDDELSSLALLTTTGALANKKSQQQVNCLVSCYLNFHIVNIDRLEKQYNECVSKVSKSPPPIESGVSLTPACETYRELYLNYVEKFKKAVEAIYGKNTTEYAEWIERLNKREVDKNYVDLITQT